MVLNQVDLSIVEVFSSFIRCVLQLVMGKFSGGSTCHPFNHRPLPRLLEENPSLGLSHPPETHGRIHGKRTRSTGSFTIYKTH